MITSTLLAAALLAASPESAPSTAVLAVADSPGPGPDLAMLSRAVRDALAERRYPALAPDEIRRRMLGQATSASLTELDRAYLGAVAAQRAGDMEGAARTLRAIVQDLARVPDGDESAAQQGRALLRLAYVETALTRKAEADALIARLLRVDPTVKPDPELYPPSFARQVDTARAALRSAPKRTLTVTTGGLPARIFVEGRERGPSPLTLSLPRAAYRISAVVGSAVVRAGVVDLTDGDRTLAVDVSVAGAFRPDGGPGIALGRGDPSATIVSVGATLGVGLVLAVSAVPERDVRHLSAAIYDVQRGRLQREGRIRLDGWTAPAGSIRALVDFLVSGVPSDMVIVQPAVAAGPDLSASPGVLLAPEAPREVPSPAPAARAGARTMGWIAFSAAVLAVGAGGLAAYEGLRASGKYSDAKGMLSAGALKLGQDPGRYNGLVRDGDSATNLSRASAGAAVALAGTGLVLGYLSYRQTGEIGPLRF